MYDDKTTEQLEQLLKSILATNEHWKSCQDGSYGMALHYSDYSKVMTEIKRRAEANELSTNTP